ncbi:hypothetical protein AAFF_G00338400 [Aldrovandia affinis]|uniref:H/ACA ribonucleoprotein complex subunit 1 n=1 Tax=Aldrovandia affinis TaxID=143900 RepID=A0AAD7R614_9TELE|nr:hypothetical protein AAFF_G00338400 [Aldrovandia affinis]
MSEGSTERSPGDRVGELATLSWYHDNLSRHAAEALLLSNGTDGSYLLRNGRKGASFLALSVRASDSVKHFQVVQKGCCYSFGFNDFACLRDFVSHFANQPLVGSETGTLIVLKYPYPRTVEEPTIYETVRVHTAMQMGLTASDLVASAPSLGTKEGYLVKQGAIVKNWKTRWFTLNRNELKYFKGKKSEEPIRTLDLTACSAVQFDYSKEKMNCFCLVFPERTFYLCAQTGTEADEWLAILQWKLSHIRKELRSAELGESLETDGEEVETAGFHANKIQIIIGQIQDVIPRRWWSRQQRGGLAGAVAAVGEDYGPPEYVVALGEFMHPCEDDIVCRCVTEENKVPYFNAPVYLENKEQIGKVDEIFGQLREFYFSVKLSENMKASSFKKLQKFYVDPMKLLPLQRFLPLPPGVKGPPRGGRGGRGGDRGRGRGGGFRGGFGGRGGGFGGGRGGGFGGGRGGGGGGGGFRGGRGAGGGGRGFRGGR